MKGVGLNCRKSKPPDTEVWVIDVGSSPRSRCACATIFFLRVSWKHCHGRSVPVWQKGRNSVLSMLALIEGLREEFRLILV